MTTKSISAESVTFTDSMGTTFTASGGVVTFQELPGFDLASRDGDVPLTFDVAFRAMAFDFDKALDAMLAAEPVEPKAMNRAQRRAARRKA